MRFFVCEAHEKSTAWTSFVAIRCQILNQTAIREAWPSWGFSVEQLSTSVYADTQKRSISPSKDWLHTWLCQNSRRNVKDNTAYQEIPWYQNVKNRSRRYFSSSSFKRNIIPQCRRNVLAACRSEATCASGTIDRQPSVLRLSDRQEAH
jgi:hypothetical protein